MTTPRPYVGGDGNLYQRALTDSSAGTVENPDVAYFALDYSEESPITGASMPSGGIGVIGWLSGIWKFLNDRLTSLGQKTKSGSIPVVIASDQDAIAITGSITATNPSVGTTGSATPSNATTLGASDGTNLLALRATTGTPAGTEAGLIIRSHNLQNIDTDLGATNDSAASSDAGTFSLIALFKRLLGKTPSLGANTAANSTPVTLANDGVFAVAFGATTDSVAGSDTATASLIALFKRSLQSLTSLINIFTRPTIVYVTGTISSSGDNTIVSAQGAGVSIYITHLVIQNESSTATTIILKDSSNRLRCLGQSQGNGLALTFSERREIKLAANTALILNLSGANSCGYSIGYYTGA